MQLLTVLPLCILLTFGTASALKSKDEPPAWPKSYSVSGVLRLPYAELNEPFDAWYDGKSSRSRTDFYNGLTKTYQFSAVDGVKYGAMYKVVFMSNKNVTNSRRCFQTNGTADGPVGPASILPNMTDFKKKEGAMLINDANVSMWYLENLVGKKMNKYIMYVSDKDNSPVRYEMHGFDSLLGSHYDRYYLDYTNYKAGVPSADKFVIEVKETCGNYPGPGSAENKVHFNPMSEYVHRNDRHHEEMFGKFKTQYSKSYTTDREHSTRANAFKHNVRYIHSKNRAGLSFTLSVNHIADLTPGELKVMNGRRPSKGYNGGLHFDKTLHKSTGMPDSLDWRLYGAVTPVKDQAVCGSCWSFGSTGTIEGAYFLATGKRVRLSQQELMDCSWGYGNNACDGGEDFRAYQWIMSSNGLASEADYGPYKAVDGKCSARSVKNTINIAAYYNITKGDQEALKLAMFLNGPISVAIDASHRSLSFYADGVYYEPQCGSDDDSLDHAVLAVGYGTLNGQGYWLVKNSWSTYWGNDGYVLMSMKDNNCGVATSATFVKLRV